MKTLESLLSSDFDINVEPVLYHFKSQDLNFTFSRFLDNYNAIVVSYGVCNEAIGQLKKIVDNLVNFEPQTAMIDNLAQGLKNTMLGYSKQISQKDYDNAIEWLDIMRPLVKVAEDVEKILLKLKAPKGITLTPTTDDTGKWCISIFQTRWISGPNWVESNREELMSGLKKMKTIGTIAYNDDKRSIYIKGK